MCRSVEGSWSCSPLYCLNMPSAPALEVLHKAVPLSHAGPRNPRRRRLQPTSRQTWTLLLTRQREQEARPSSSRLMNRRCSRRQASSTSSCRKRVRRFLHRPARLAMAQPAGTGPPGRRRMAVEAGFALAAQAFGRREHALGLVAKVIDARRFATASSNPVVQGRERHRHVLENVPGDAERRRKRQRDGPGRQFHAGRLVGTRL